MSYLYQLSFDFFREFSRCEFFLKAVGLREPNRKDPTADWGVFASEIASFLENPCTHELQAAVTYCSDHPPKKQITREDGFLDWQDVVPDHKSKTELILRLVCPVRNNPFHGGKFNGHWFEPQRSEDLLKHALVILNACVSMNRLMLKKPSNPSFKRDELKALKNLRGTNAY